VAARKMGNPAMAGGVPLQVDTMLRLLVDRCRFKRILLGLGNMVRGTPNWVPIACSKK